jgi:CRP-like cAMP-binding protein
MSLETLGGGHLPQQEVLLAKKDVIQQIISRLQKGDIGPSADLYRRCREDVGSELMNLAGSGPLAPNLCQLFNTAHDFYKAAQVYEKLGDLKNAAASFEQAEAYDLAADLYGRGGDFAKSAEMLERGGSHGRAAPLFLRSERWMDAGRCFEKAGQMFSAGEAYVRAGDRKKSLESLQKVPKHDADYLTAVSLLGPILEEMDLPELASRKYREAVADATVAENNIAIFYSLARLFESTERIEEAKDIYSRILEKDLTYRDVEERYRSFKEGSTPVQKAKPSEPSSSYTDVVVLSEDQSFLEKSLLFRDLSFDEIRDVVQIAEKRAFEADDILVREGEPYNGVFLIQSGKVLIGVTTEGREVDVARFGPGNHFGEMSILNHKIAQITFRGAEPGSCLFIESGRLRSLLNGRTTLQVKMLRNIIASLDLHLLQTKEIVKTLVARQAES